MEGQREKARAKSTFKGGARRTRAWTAGDAIARQLDAARREGLPRLRRRRRSTRRSSRCSTANRQEVPSLDAGQHGFVALAETPFYLEAGGQVSDAGTHRGSRRRGDGDRGRRAPGTGRGLHARAGARAATLSRARPGDARRSTPPSGTRPAATTRRRTCSTPRFARCSARTSSRRARSSRPTGCASTSSTSAP